MRLLSFSAEGKESWGAVAGDGVVDLGRALGSRYPTLQDFIASPDYSRRGEIVAGLKADRPLSGIRFLPVIPRPEKIICLVRNYMDHHQEVLAAGLQRELSKFPPIFLRAWRSQVGHGEPIVRPRVSPELDWEAELAVIVGKGGRHIAEKDAMGHIAGYSCYNDVSVREWQFHAKTEQSSSTKHLIFGIPAIISYCSTIFDLAPGDVLVTGTPAGVGWSRKPPQFLKQGDVVEVEIEKIGVLRNPVVDE
jgi:2-keto-4-pentenoate hydratase/2-oxohepta-3-ene-1,7-dioic acid hydratase in catechol pathway